MISDDVDENQDSNEELFISQQPSVSSLKRPYSATVENENDDSGDAEPAESVATYPAMISIH